MSRARAFSAVLALAVGLLFYVAYRSDRTLSNRLVAWAGGPTVYSELKHEVRKWLPVPMALRGCLPSALWCFIATSLFSGWSMRITPRLGFALGSLAPLANGFWEFVQGIGWTDGHGDLRDVAAGLVGWMVAQALFRNGPPAEIPLRWNWRLGIVTCGMACMGLADVWK